MWSKSIFIALILMITISAKLNAALPIMYLNSATATESGIESIKANYDLMKMQLHFSASHVNPASTHFYNENDKKCLTSKIGRGLMIGGGGLFLVGAVIVSSGDKDSLGGGLCIFVGLLGLIWGGILAIIGGIYNASGKSRYSLVSPKPNEVGISYTFK